MTGTCSVCAGPVEKRRGAWAHLDTIDGRLADQGHRAVVRDGPAGRLRANECAVVDPATLTRPTLIDGRPTLTVDGTILESDPVAHTSGDDPETRCPNCGGSRVRRHVTTNPNGVYTVDLVCEDCPWVLVDEEGGV